MCLPRKWKTVFLCDRGMRKPSETSHRSALRILSKINDTRMCPPAALFLANNACKPKKKRLAKTVVHSVSVWPDFIIQRQLAPLQNVNFWSMTSVATLFLSLMSWFLFHDLLLQLHAIEACFLASKIDRNLIGFFRLLQPKSFLRLFPALKAGLPNMAQLQSGRPTCPLQIFQSKMCSGLAEGAHFSASSCTWLETNLDTPGFLWDVSISFFFRRQTC